jgi:hypothetical protein
VIREDENKWKTSFTRSSRSAESLSKQNGSDLTYFGCREMNRDSLAQRETHRHQRCLKVRVERALG